MPKNSLLGRILTPLYNFLHGGVDGVLSEPQVPRIIIELDDDGISTDVWKDYAQRFLKDGYTVLALTEPSNEFGAIGVGDGLWWYDKAGLRDNNAFFEAKIQADEDSVLILKERIESLGPKCAICFNMDFFEWLNQLAGNDQKFVVGLLGEMDGPAIFGHYALSDTSKVKQIPELIKSLKINIWEGHECFRISVQNEQWFNARIKMFSPAPKCNIRKSKKSRWSVFVSHGN